LVQHGEDYFGNAQMIPKIISEGGVPLTSDVGNFVRGYERCVHNAVGNGGALRAKYGTARLQDIGLQIGSFEDLGNIVIDPSDIPPISE
jgi:hypothetical protein